MLKVVCSGDPYNIGKHHGLQAKSQIHGSISFYKAYFQTTAQLDWAAACKHGRRFLPFLQGGEPQFIQEIQGVADGAGVPFDSILALNVRTEIVYGLSKDDGCTALSWHNHEAWLAQNWDWRAEQGPNLIYLVIGRLEHTICMITEAGIIGKIGFNSAGIGVCLNALRVQGVDYMKLPVHLTLRKILDYQGDLDEIVEYIKECGVASSAHILAASADTAYGIETTHLDVVVLEPQIYNAGQVILHTNHLLASHEEVVERLEVPDSIPRQARIDELMRAQIGLPQKEKIDEMLRDEQGYPVSICRDVQPGTGSSTVFSIAMNLTTRYGYVKVGRPVANGENIVLNPQLEHTLLFS